MVEAYGIYHWVNLALSVFLVLLTFVIAVIAFYRFRASPAGLAVGGSYLAFSCIVFLSTVFYAFFLPRLGPGWPGYMIAQVLFGLADLLFTIILAVGIGLIPTSLRKMAPKS